VRGIQVVEPASSRGGRRFEAVLERDLHGLAHLVAASMPGPTGNVILIPEMPSPLGLPDFVALVGGQKWLASRASVQVPPVLSEIDCTVLSALSVRRPLSATSVGRRLGWATDQVTPVISRLTRIRAVTLTASGAAIADPALKPEGVLYAIETKVKDWRRAIIQGRGYRTWANNYVMVLGGVGDRAAERVRLEVGADGAGLYTEHGWVVKPRNRVPLSARRVQGFEYAYAALASGPTLGD
jgi:hypothetical protein